MHPLLLTVLTLTAEFVGAAILCYAVGGGVWLFSGRKKPFPRKAILVFTLILFAISVPRSIPGLRTAFHDHAIVDSLSSVVSTFRSAVGGSATADDLRSAVRELDPARMSDATANLVVGMISLSADRYGDLLQSYYHGQVIRTPLSVSVPRSFESFESELRARDEQWTPLLQSASRGEPVSFSDGEVDVDGIYLFGLFAAWARYESLDEFARHRGSEHYLTEDERRTGFALSWLPSLVQVSEAGPDLTELTASLASANVAFDLTEDLELARGIAEPAVSDEALVAFLTYSQLITEADLETAVALMRTVLEGEDADWGRINTRRRALGHAVVMVPEDLLLAAQARVLPWQLDDAGMPIDEKSLARLELELARKREVLRLLEAQGGW